MHEWYEKAVIYKLSVYVIPVEQNPRPKYRVTEALCENIVVLGFRRRQMSLAGRHLLFKNQSFDQRLSWWDPDARCRLVISQPKLDPQLWAQYGRGAVRSYRRHGVECALDRPAMDSGDDTVMFFVALDATDAVVAGVRAKGPLTCAEESHALIEWQDQRGRDAVCKMITDRIPYGVLEMKSAWVSDQTPCSSAVAEAVARSGIHMLALLDVQFFMATAAAYVLNRWRSSGGVIAPVPATPYPDARYQTKMMWWDRSTFIHHAQPRQAAKILTEARAITVRPSEAALGQ